MDELQIKLNEYLDRMQKSQESLQKLGYNSALAEKEYRIEKAKQILIERNKGTPISILSDIVKGNSKISEFRFNADVAQSIYDAARENINTCKFSARVLHEQITREYRG